MRAFFLLLACAHRAPRDTTADTSVDDTALPAPACGEWSGVARVGTRWTYAPTDAYVERWGMDGTYTAEVTALAPTATLSQSGAYSGEDGSFTWEREDTWRCDGGWAWWTGSEATSDTSAGAHVTGSRTFEPGLRVRPPSAEPGDTWSDAFTLTQVANGGAPTVTDVTCTTVVSAADARDLDGRPLTVRRLDTDCVGMNVAPLWIAAGVGLVLTDDEELVAYAE